MINAPLPTPSSPNTITLYTGIFITLYTGILFVPSRPVRILWSVKAPITGGFFSTNRPLICRKRRPERPGIFHREGRFRVDMYPLDFDEGRPGSVGVGSGSLVPDIIFANVNCGAILLISSKDIGSAITEMTEISFRLKPDNMLHAFVRTSELAKEASESLDWTRMYTRVRSKVTSKSRGEMALLMEASGGMESSDFERSSGGVLDSGT